MSLSTKISERLKKLWRSIQYAIQNKKIRQFLYAAIILISVAFIAYAIATNWTQLKSQHWQLDPLYVILSIVLYPLGMVPTAAGWHWLLKAFNEEQPFKVNLRIYAISSLPKHIPGFLWYVTSRTLMYDEIGINTSTVLGATVAETILMPLSGFVAALFIFSLASDISMEFSIIRYVAPIALFALILLFFWAPGGTRLLNRLVNRLRKDAQPIQFRRSHLAISLGWMFIAWIGGGTLLWILVRGFTPLGLRLLPTMVGIWGAAGAVSLTIGIGIQGLGLREVTLGAILSTLISPLISVVVAIAFRLVLIVGEFLWVALISILIKKPTRLKYQSQ